jgi:3-oxoacyl-[acyl-carrier-protein] synthase-1
VETISACKARNASFQAVVDEVGLGKEADHFFSGKVNRGIGLSQAIDQALSNTSVTLPFAGDLISDLNGENWRAYELAGTRILLSHKISSEAPLILPCISLGEVGAASGGVALCVAIQSFARHYSHSDRVLILTSSERGDVGAACLRKIL